MQVVSESNMKDLGERVGVAMRGGEIIELIGDVGAGKTTFVKGLAKGLQIDDDVQSPSFTISRVYPARDDLTLNHYDFYRLADAGIMKMELAEVFGDTRSVTAIEWSDSVADILPSRKMVINFSYIPDSDGRELTFDIPADLSYLRKALE